MEADKKKKYLTTAAIIFLFVGMGVLKGLYRNEEGIEEVLTKYAQNMNQKCPITLDNNTKMDGVQYTDGNSLTYYYTVFDCTALLYNQSTNENAIKTEMLNKIHRLKDIDLFKKYHVSLRFLYRNSNGVTVIDITIKPDEY